MEPMPPRESPVPTYRSGAAARLAGIPVATLRMWERRYRVVGPQTSARGHRRYGAEDVRRLALIKSLVDRGHAIGTLAHLPFETMRAMSAEAPPRAARGLHHARELVYSDGLDLEDPQIFTPIGVSCRICPRPDCSERAMPSLAQRLQIDENRCGFSTYAEVV